MSDFFENPGERLLFAIKDSDMTQRKFAELIGMSPNGLNAIVKGKKRLSRILALATEQITGVEALINEAKRIIDFFMHSEASEGQGPYRLGLMIMYGEFSEKQLENSSAALFTDENRHPSIGRIREIRLELDDLMNKPNTKGD